MASNYGLSTSDTAWTFATEFYARPGIEPAFLHLQEAAGLDVLLLLTLLHAGRRGCAIGAESLALLLAATHHWQGPMILPLRKIRRLLARPEDGIPDEAREALRAQIKEAELAAEHLVLDRLERLLPTEPNAEPGAAIRANLGAYLTVLPNKLNSESESVLADLALAATQI